MSCEFSAGLQGGAYVRKLCRRHWRTEVVAGGDLTADIIRAVDTAPGDPSLGIPPTTTIATGLSGLSVAVAHPGMYDAMSRTGDYVQLREFQREFAFLDIPASGTVSAGLLQLDDRISFDGDIWKPVRVWNEPTIGISRCVAQLDDRD